MRSLFALALLSCLPPALSAEDKPNVILIMTDDQGYGDLACHGNPILKTPHLDALYEESIRLTDFHVSPFCTPTRAALMTSRYPARTSAFRTSSGRTMMHPDERTMAHLFADAGYSTGMVGKWHLGDNAPHRPQDRGFQHVVWHRCGGVGQGSDYWGNDYFDDTYEVNGTFQKFDGYCTDVWFEKAMNFVESKKDEPFFLYLATNAPHGPYIVAKEWSDPYRDEVTWNRGAEFYGMITNFDHNVGLLRAHLNELGLSENTIFIFLTDNGTAQGGKFSGLESVPSEGFNAGMRGKKSSVVEGGHRVPFFIHWPAGGLTGGQELDHLAAHLDVLPTLADLCGFEVPVTHETDGFSFASALDDPKAAAHREQLIVQFQGGPYFSGTPAPWEHTCILMDQWRLINGSELYDIEKDLSQQEDLAARHPEIVAQLRADYPAWWEEVSQRMTPVAIDLGNPADNPTTLCSQDWYMPTGNPPWNFGQIRKRPAVTGPWNVHVQKAGRYRFTLRELPKEAGISMHAIHGRLEIAGKSAEADAEPGATGITMELDLPTGRTELKTWLTDASGKTTGAFFTDVEAL